MEQSVDAIRDCANSDDAQLILSDTERDWLDEPIGAWTSVDDDREVLGDMDTSTADSPSILARTECYWETLGTLLWALHVFPAMPYVSEPFSRQRVYTVTAITPARPTSIATWIRGFETAARPEEEGFVTARPQGEASLHSADHDDFRQRGTRRPAEIAEELRIHAAWRWRSVMHDLHQAGTSPDVQATLAKKHPHLRAMFRNLERGIQGAAALAVNHGLVELSVDDDFGVRSPAQSTGISKTNAKAKKVAPTFQAYRDITTEQHGMISTVTEGRVVALSWLLTGEIHEPPFAKEQVLALGVDAIWGVREDDDKPVTE